MKENEPEGVFVEFFGKDPRVKVLQCLLEGRELDFGVGDIAREIEINRVTAYQVMRELEEERIIVPTRKVGKGQLYKLNTENENVQLMIRTFNAMLHKIAEAYAEPEQKESAHKRKIFA